MGVTYVGSPPGWTDFWEQWADGRWEPRTHAIINEYADPARTYVDIGAWIGPTVIWAQPHYRRVVALEPDPVAYKDLITNVYRFTNVEPLNMAIALTTGEGQFAPRGGQGFGSSMSRLNPPTDGWNTDQATTVKTVSVPDLFDIYHLDDVALIKIDIEGSEADILEEACPYLYERRIVVCLSLHPDWYNQPVDVRWWSMFTEIRGTGTPDDPMLLIP